MLPAVGPLTSIGSAVRPYKLAITFFAVIIVFPNIFPAVVPNKVASSVHLVALPGPFVNTAIFPGVDAFPVDMIAEELSHVRRGISPYEVS